MSTWSFATRFVEVTRIFFGCNCYAPISLQGFLHLEKTTHLGTFLYMLIFFFLLKVKSPSSSNVTCTKCVLPETRLLSSQQSSVSYDTISIVLSLDSHALETQSVSLDKLREVTQYIVYMCFQSLYCLYYL